MIIKCRGYSEESQRWVYGLLSGIGEDVAEIKDINTNECVSVPIKSIGFDTGLFDENGISIYEGDILRDKSNMPPNYDKPCLVYYYFGMFRCGEMSLASFTVFNNVEIVGNYFENPELLKIERENESEEYG